MDIGSEKLVHDFSGNEYIVTECSPIGYMIYSVQSGVFVEYLPESPSPYAGYSGENLYYGGPTEYYVLENDTFNHTITEESILDNDSDQIHKSN